MSRRTQWLLAVILLLLVTAALFGAIDALAWYGGRGVVR